ncbi:MAG: glycoside hydrolase family 88 protein [Treponema sp.]|jgi:unsaturated chondroitin disaccharide hydrolase|nr:glycoside hydrolase family 88 protein [Treponema sp.]
MPVKRLEKEGIDRARQFSTPPKTDTAFWHNALEAAGEKIRKNIPVFGNRYPAPASERNVYPLIDNTKWTSAFWPGMLWLAWMSTGNDEFRWAAESYLPDFQSRLENRVAVDTQNLGFIYNLSCITPWRLTGDVGAKDTALKAANLLMKQGSITNSLNLSLLFWATEVTGNPYYRDAAEQHLGNVNHTRIQRDWATIPGKALMDKLPQSPSEEFCWSQAQAWAMYGNILAYRYTHHPEYLETAWGLSSYFLNRLPNDLVAYWNLEICKGQEPRDSSASAIAVCALQELGAALPLAKNEHWLFENAALHIMVSLIKSYTTAATPESTGLLLHGAYNIFLNEGVDECVIFGDYFYIEALARICRGWHPCW